MRKTLLFLWVFTTIITSCNENLLVEISPVVPPVIPYNKATGSYYGNYERRGVAYFTLELSNASNPNSGINLTGFCTLPSSFANFKLDEGTYNLASTGNIRTFNPGSQSDNIVTGTYLYDANTNRRTLITGGSFTVTLSDNTYNISTDLLGIDTSTDLAVTNIRIDFTGEIAFTDHSIMVASSYTASGTPKWRTPSGPESWSGTVEPVQGASYDWYRISNWSNLNITIFCDQNTDGTLEIDNYSKVFTDDTYDYYFELAYIDGSTLTMISPENYGYLVHYNPITKVLDFTGTITKDGITREALVGIACYSKATGQIEKTYSDFYAGLKLQLTPVQTTSLNVATCSFDGVADIDKLTTLNAKPSRMISGGKKAEIGIRKIEKEE